MSNKRIQKKQAKAEWERDKGKLVANFLRVMYPGCSHYEYLRLGKPLFKLDRDTLLHLIDRITMQEILRFSPFMQVLPRQTFDASTLVDWYPVVSNHGVK